MGFWHTGYTEFHEPVGYGEGFVPPPIVYTCSHCGEIFKSDNELRAHHFEKHPHKRPVLLFRGIEMGNSTIKIFKRFELEDIEIEECSSASINNEPVPIDKISLILLNITNDTVVLKLNNEFVTTEFRIIFEIASDDHLVGVDRCFMEVARRGMLDMRALEIFIDSARAFPSAMTYCDGICEYFYGVLVKEGAKESTLPFEAYRDKFNRASDTLVNFGRPLSNTICALISFHFNHFSEAARLAGFSRVGVAASRYQQWLSGDSSAARKCLSTMRDDSLEKMLTDYKTEQILQWSVKFSEDIISHTREIETHIRKEITEYDRAKLRILLAELFLEKGLEVEAHKHLREFINNPDFGKWAENLLKRLEMGKLQEDKSE